MSFPSRRMLGPALVALLTLALAISLTSTASGQHSATALISTGPSGGNGPFSACPFKPCGLGISKTGTRVFFESRERLVSADTDSSTDVYERSLGVTTLVSTGPSGGNGAYFAQFLDSSDDGSRVFLWTQERLVSGDTDDYFDVYERSGGTTTLVSVGPSGGNGQYAAKFAGASADGTHVFFRTQEPMTAGDTDDEWDLYERMGGSTSLVSIGPSGGNGRHPAQYAGSSTDGSHVFFTTRESLVSADSDSNCQARPCIDVYERTGGATTLVSTGPTGTNASRQATFIGASDDGSRVFFVTQEALAAPDTDQKVDLYERSGGTTTLVSTGPSDQQAWDVCTAPVCPIRISADGTRVFFMTHESLLPGDSGYLDVFERSFGTTKLVSTGPFGGDGPYHVVSFRMEISNDGTHAFFETPEKLVMGDTDSTADVYERSGGMTTLVSTGPTAATGPDARVVGVSEDGMRVFFETAEKLVAADTDSQSDVYERFAGTTTLISTGPTDDGSAAGDFLATSPDGSHVLFQTLDALVAADTDSNNDLYDSSIAYQVPQSASPIQVALVPVFRQCGTGGNPANGQHAPPLTTGSCLPPKANVGQAAKIGSASVGLAGLIVVPGNPDTTADEADVTINANLTDVKSITGGGDYVPNAGGADVTMVTRLRLTDLANCSGSACSGPYARTGATTTDLDFGVPIDCTATPDPSLGSTCAINSSVDAVQPGAATEGRQAVVQIFRVRLNDSGANNVRGDSDDRIFSTQGIYVP